MKKSLMLVAGLGLWFSLTAQLCTKVLVYSKDFNTQPHTALLENDVLSVSEATKKVLEKEGFVILTFDPVTSRIVTGWRPVGADTHYALLFERKDYGVSDGAYYQLIADFIPEGNKIKLSLSTVVKSIAGKLQSSGKIEKKVLAQVEDQLRPAQIEMNNVGVKRK